MASEHLTIPVVSKTETHAPYKATKRAVALRRICIILIPVVLLLLLAFDNIQLRLQQEDWISQVLHLQSHLQKHGAPAEILQHKPGSKVVVKFDAEKQSSVLGLPAGKVAEHQSVESHLIAKEKIEPWNYQCWTPKMGLSQPVITIASVLGGLKESYHMNVRMNRLLYASKHGYRYCELTSIDKHQIPAFAKLPWMLAMLPCSDYVIHVDADAQFYKLDTPLTPWVDHMKGNNIDLLLSSDVIRESPINFGVFFVRTAPWIWEFFKRLYNHCTCSWGRTHDWPAEQGILYDLLAMDMKSHWFNHSKIVRWDGWNHILGPQELPKSDDVLVHLTYPTIYPDDSPCQKQKHFTKECKYIGLEHFLKAIVSKDHDYSTDPATLFNTGFTCQKVRDNRLFSGDDTYQGHPDRKSASALDFDVDPATGRILGVKLGEVGCVGWRQYKCNLPELWNKDKGEGPWSMWQGHIKY